MFFKAFTNHKLCFSWRVRKAYLVGIAKSSADFCTCFSLVITPHNMSVSILFVCTATHVPWRSMYTHTLWYNIHTTYTSVCLVCLFAARSPPGVISGFDYGPSMEASTFDAGGGGTSYCYYSNFFSRNFWWHIYGYIYIYKHLIHAYIYICININIYIYTLHFYLFKYHRVLLPHQDLPYIPRPNGRIPGADGWRSHSLSKLWRQLRWRRGQRPKIVMLSFFLEKNDGGWKKTLG